MPRTKPLTHAEEVQKWTAIHAQGRKLDSMTRIQRSAQTGRLLAASFAVCSPDLVDPSPAMAELQRYGIQHQLCANGHAEA